MKLFEPKKKIANPENVDLPEKVACGSGYSGYFLSIRIREKRLSGSTGNELLSPESCKGSEEKSAGSEKVEPSKKLMCGSNHLNCRWVFGSAKRLVDPRVSDPQEKCPDPKEKELDPGVVEPWKRTDQRI